MQKEMSEEKDFAEQVSILNRRHSFVGKKLQIFIASLKDESDNKLTMFDKYGKNVDTSVAKQMKVGTVKKGTKAWFAEQEDDAKMKR